MRKLRAAARGPQVGGVCGGFRAWSMLVLGWLSLQGCGSDLPPKEPEIQRSLGTELYIVLCEHLAATEFPEDVRGRTALATCWYDAPAPPAGVRLEALRATRPRLVSAFDALLEHPDVRDGLVEFSLELLPLYDPPEEIMPAATRASARLLASLIEDPEALAALQRMSARGGYRPLRHALGALTAVFQAPAAGDALRSMLGAMDQGGAAAESWATLREGLALELASYGDAADKTVPGEGGPGLLAVIRALLLREDPALAAGQAPLWMVQRGPRGYARPDVSQAGALATRGDGSPNVDAHGRFTDLQGRPLEWPTPFSTVVPDGVNRDAEGRPLTDSGASYYSYQDVRPTLLSGLLAELQGWSEDDSQGDSVLTGLIAGMQPLLGPEALIDASYGVASARFQGRDLDSSSLLPLIDVVGLLAEMPETYEALELFDRLLVEQQPLVASFAKAMIQASDRSRLHVDAKIEHPAPFWEQLVWVMERAASRSRVEGENQLESMLRAFADPRTEHLGGLMAVMARYKDPFDLNPEDINLEVIGQFQTLVDRERPDEPGNESQLWSFVHVVGELMDRPLCNRVMPAGDLIRLLMDDSELLAQTADLTIGDLGECDFINAPDLGRAFGKAMTGEFEFFDAENMSGPLQSLLTLIGQPPEFLVSVMDERFREQSQLDEFDTTPTGPAFVRLLFAQDGSPTAEFASSILYPFLVKPFLYNENLDPALFTDRDAAPSKYVLRDAYPKALPAWEVRFDFGDGQPVSMMESIGPLLEALNKHDIDKLEHDAGEFDSGRYMFNPMVEGITWSYASRASMMAAERGKPFFSYRSNLVSYESLIAEILGEPIAAVDSYRVPFSDGETRPYMDAQQQAWWNAQRGLGLMTYLHRLTLVLDDMDMGQGRDGIDVLSGLLTRLLNANMYCDPEGDGLVGRETLADGTLGPPRGACQRPGRLRDGLRFRDSGEDFLRWESDIEGWGGGGGQGLPYAYDGRGFAAQDGEEVRRAKRSVSPMQILLDSLNDIDASFDAPGMEQTKRRWRGARSDLVDQLFASDGERFTNPRALPLLRGMLAWSRERLAAHGATAGDRAGQRLWASGLSGGAQEVLQGPIVQGLVGLMADVQRDPEGRVQLARLMNHLVSPASDGVPGTGGLEPFALAVADMLQLMEDDENLVPLFRAFSQAFVVNAREVVEGGAAPSGEPATFDAMVRFLHRVLDEDIAGDGRDTLTGMMRLMVTPSETHMQGREAPLETIIDVITEVNRVSPGARGPMDAADLTVLFQQSLEMMTDDLRGVERMYQIVQHRTLEPAWEVSP